MKKIITILTVVSLATVSYITSCDSNNGITQAASSWHKGMPRSLHGNWYGKRMVLIISNNHVYFIPVTGTAVSKAKKLIYRKRNHNTIQYRITWREGGKYTGTIKQLNKHTVRFNGYTLRRR